MFVSGLMVRDEIGGKNRNKLGQKTAFAQRRTVVFSGQGLNVVRTKVCPVELLRGKGVVA